MNKSLEMIEDGDSDDNNYNNDDDEDTITYPVVIVSSVADAPESVASDRIRRRNGV